MGVRSFLILGLGFINPWRSLVIGDECCFQPKWQGRVLRPRATCQDHS